MLDDFIVTNRATIIARTQARVAARAMPTPTEAELRDGIPRFLDQLGDALRLAKSSDDINHDQLDAAAGRHGGELLRMGLTIGQVVHDYGDICQVITELAVQEQAPISGEEFRTLNLCLDDAIAGVPFNCPGCGGVLWEVAKGGVLRYRCHTGHAYTSSVLLAEQTAKIEETLWIALRMFEERRNLLTTMSESNGPGFSSSAGARAKESEVHIDRIRGMLRAGVTATPKR